MQAIDRGVETSRLYQSEWPLISCILPTAARRYFVPQAIGYFLRQDHENADERRAISQLHLPANHGVEPAFLREVAGRCPLTGGQIRNAALHAAVLALNDCGMVRSEHIAATVQREYRKLGAICPLRVQYAREPATYR